MVSNRQQVLGLLAVMLPMSAVAQYPSIEEMEGFEVDMEPFWVETEYDDTNSVPLDVQGYFKTEMEVVLPNILGVLLQRYDDDGSTTAIDLEGGGEETRTNSSSSRAFYTGMAVFRGPPFRTNHDVYQAQTAAMTSLQAAKTYLKVQDASLGVPDWFNSTSLENPDKAVMLEETDGSLTINPDLLLETNAKGSGSFSMEGLAVGAALGLVAGAVLTFIVMLCYRRHVRSNRDSSSSSSKAPCTPRRHKRKTSDDSDLPVHDHDHQDHSGGAMDFDIDSNNNSSSSEDHDERGDILPEAFHDEEIADGEEVISFTDSPVRDITPRKRRPSHHRRWKSTAAFTDMQSPSSVMDGLFMTSPSTPMGSAGSSTTNNNSHRRSNSLADAFGGGGLHRRSKSVADAFTESVENAFTGNVNAQTTRDRRESMMELLGGVDMNDLMNDLDMDMNLE